MTQQKSSARTRLRLFLCGAALWALVVDPSGVRAQSPAPAASAPAASPSASPSPSPAAPVVTLAEIAEKSQSDLALLNGFEPDSAPDQAMLSARKTLQEMPERITQLLADGAKVIGAGSSLDALRNLQHAWKKLDDDLGDRSAALGQRAKVLDTETNQVQQIEKLWQATGKTAKEGGAPGETLQLIQDVIDAVNGAKHRIKERRTAVLELQSRASELGTRLRSGQDAVQQQISNAVKMLLVRDSLPLWAPQSQLGASAIAQRPETLGEQYRALAIYSQDKVEWFGLHVVIVIVLLGVILWLRRGLHRWTEDEPHLARAAPIFDTPLAAAIALSFVIPLYADAPNLFKAVIGAIALLPTIVILRRLLDTRLFPMLYSLVGFYFLDQVRVAATAFPILNRWVFCGEMVLAILVFIRLAMNRRDANTPAGNTFVEKWAPALTRLAIALLAAALAANAVGYSRLGTLMGSAVLNSGYTAVFLYALLRVLEGLLAIALRVQPLNSSHIAQQHRKEVQRQTYRVLRYIAAILWMLATLDYFQLRALFFEKATLALDYTLTAGALDISLGRVLSFAAAIWLSIIIARMLRFFLNEEVYERVSLAPGLPYAITTMANYAILLVGFFIALGLLGVDLTKITILAGAFSVGLGFGLQNIINNFVSGIILLFERPVKVGDIIQIGDAVGEVRRIGIRASVVHMRDGSDIILPNGNLISNQVTNWTYSDRRRAVEIPVTVAAGPEPNRVLDLLRQTAAEVCTAQHDPAPQAYITGISGANLSFVVRAWTSRYEDWIEARSELSAAIVTALGRENIRLV